MQAVASAEAIGIADLGVDDDDEGPHRSGGLSEHLWLPPPGMV